jgi:gluconolactonase
MPTSRSLARELVLVAETDAHEGPVYVADEEALYFTTVRTDRVSIKRLELATGTETVLRADANMANGMALAPDGRLVVCEQGTHETLARITAVDRASGSVEVLADEGLSSPNDIVVARDGSIWFTDPTYGWLQGFRPKPTNPDRVYRLDPSGRLEVVSEDFDKPNGLAFSPDERRLYVSDNGAPHSLLAFQVSNGGRLTAGRVVAVSTPEHPDGLKVDANGRIFASAATGVQILDPSGELLDEIALPGAVNFAFGGPDRNTLFITADTAVWAVHL